MTVSTSQRRVAYAGNGVTTAFSVPFPFPAAGDVRVVRTVAGAESALVLNVDFTVTGAGNPAGGTVTITPAPAVGQTITIRRVVARTQETDYVPNDPFPADAHEAALDKLTMITQEDGDDIGRALLVPDTDPRRGEMILPTVAGRAGKMMSMDAMGRPEFGISTAAVASAIALATAPGAAQLADNVAYAPPGAGAQPTNVAEVLRRSRSVFDFFTPAQINDVAMGFGALDVSAALQAAADAVAVTGGTLHQPAGWYNNGGATWEIPQNVTLWAEDGAVLFQPWTSNVTCLRILGRSFATNVRRPRFMSLPQVVKGGYAFSGTGSWFDGTDTSSRGIHVQNCSDDTFRVTGACNFFENFYTDSTWDPLGDPPDLHLAVNNTLLLGNLRNGRYNIRAGFGANSWTVLGGVINVDQAWLGGSGATYVELGYDGVGGGESNYWVFVGTNMEGFIVPGTVAINCYSGWNRWVNCRFEKLPAGAIKFRGALAVMNSIDGGLSEEDIDGYYNALIDPAHRGFGTAIRWSYVLSGRGFTLDFAAASQKPIRVGPNNAVPNVCYGSLNNNRAYLSSLAGAPLVGTRYQGNMHQEVVTISSGTAWAGIPANGVIADYAAPTTVTSWTDPSVGADVTARWYVWASNGNLTLQHSGSPTTGQFVFRTGVNKTLAAGEVVSGITINGIRYADL